MIKVNSEKCIKCYSCLSVCPFRALQKSENDFPGLIEEGNCLECTHCTAICPTDAITLDDESGVLDEDVPTLPADFYENLRDHVVTRRSYRHFRSEQVKEELIEEILNIAAWAPSAKNNHPNKWIVINSKEVMEKMMVAIISTLKEKDRAPEVVSEYEAGNNVVMGNAPTLIISYADSNAANPVGDSYIAMATAELLLQSKGIGTCWCGYLTRFLNWMPKLQKILPELPDGHTYQAAFMLGYPTEKYIHIPKRKNKADIIRIE